MAGTTGVGEEVRTNWLDASLSSGGETASGFEIFLRSPSLWQEGKGEVDLGVGSHFEVIDSEVAEALRKKPKRRLPRPLFGRTKIKSGVISKSISTR